LFIARGGDVTGRLPYSRMTTYMGTGRAVAPTRVAKFPRTLFPEMLQRMPVLAERLVGMMTDRVRETTRMEQQREKLASLGKLSAGLAHELNNPAAAAKRAAGALRETREALRCAYLRLDKRELTPAQRETIAEFERQVNERAVAIAPDSIDALERSDREDSLSSWLSNHGVPDSWKITGTLVEAGIATEDLEKVVAEIGVDALGDTVNRIALAIAASRLVAEIEHSTTRISELVRAIKEYSYMDQAPEQEIDIHDGIESTLTILSHKLKKNGIKVAREYDRSLPRICAFASELNQVWTNLIDNAADAMNAGGELRIHSAREPSNALLEIADTGTGIAPEIQPHIFDPFFTTKGVGEGSGLGLETVRRIVRKHRGDIRLESKPGRTVFQVRLPLPKTA
jgi:signal transduction histidine kinase